MSSEPFNKFTIFFSTYFADFSKPVAKGTPKSAATSWTPSSGTWKKLLTSSYNEGSSRPIYWMVVGTRADKSTEESEVRSFRVGASQAVVIGSPANGAVLASGIPPTFVFDTNCNTKFKLEISSQDDFDSSKTKGFSYSVKDPNVEPTLQKQLTSGQWNGVKSLVGEGTGYFRIRTWDGLKRETVSEVRSFTID